DPCRAPATGVDLCRHLCGPGVPSARPRVISQPGLGQGIVRSGQCATGAHWAGVCHQRLVAASVAARQRGVASAASYAPPVCRVARRGGAARRTLWVAWFPCRPPPGLHARRPPARCLCRRFSWQPGAVAAGGADLRSLSRFAGPPDPCHPMGPQPRQCCALAHGGGSRLERPVATGDLALSSGRPAVYGGVSVDMHTRVTGFRYTNEAVWTLVLVTVLIFVLALVQAGRLREWFDPGATIKVILPADGLFGLTQGAQVDLLGTRAGGRCVGSSSTPSGKCTLRSMSAKPCWPS